jgi:hypothetical protein
LLLRRQQQQLRSQVWFSGSTEEAFDFVCDIHIGPITS